MKFSALPLTSCERSRSSSLSIVEGFKRESKPQKSRDGSNGHLPKKQLAKHTPNDQTSEFSEYN